MTISQPTPVVHPPGQCPPVPTAAWLVGLFATLESVAQIVDEGPAEPGIGLALSIVVSGVVVAWFARGVMTGRAVRGAVALAIAGLSVLLQAFTLLVGVSDGLWPLLHLALGAVTLTALLLLVSSPYHRWQRLHHDTSGVDLGGVLLLAALAGMLGPIAADGPESAGFHVEIGL